MAALHASGLETSGVYVASFVIGVSVTSPLPVGGRVLSKDDLTGSKL